MRRIAVPIALSALLIQVIACAGAQTKADRGQVVIEVGSNVSASLERDADGRVLASVGSTDSSLDAYVGLDFSDKSMFPLPGMLRMLKITNRSRFNLRMRVLICIDRGTRCRESNVVPLGPDGSTYETWSEPIDVIRLFDFQLDEPS